MRRSNHRRGFLLLGIIVTLCLDTGACGRGEDPEEVASLELSFSRSSTYIEVDDTASLELTHNDRMAAVYDSIRWNSDDPSVAVVNDDEPSW